MLVWLLRRLAAVDRVENGELGLFDRRYGVVDCKTGLPFQSVGAPFGTFHIVIVLGVDDIGFQVVHVVGYLRLHCAPVSGRRVFGRFDVLIYLVDGLGRRGMRPFLARRDLIALPSRPQPMPLLRSWREPTDQRVGRRVALSSGCSFDQCASAKKETQVHPTRRSFPRWRTRFPQAAP